MITIKNYIMLFLGSTLLIMIGCKKADVPGVPSLTTSPVTNIASSTATSGGTITSNGGSPITFSGIVWSKVNAIPTLADDTTIGTVSTGTFVANMKNLSSTSTYYVRAYAINGVGTGYGNVVTFMTGNAP